MATLRHTGTHDVFGHVICNGASDGYWAAVSRLSIEGLGIKNLVSVALRESWRNGYHGKVLGRVLSVHDHSLYVVSGTLGKDAKQHDSWNISKLCS